MFQIEEAGGMFDSTTDIKVTDQVDAKAVVLRSYLFERRISHAVTEDCCFSQKWLPMQSDVCMGSLFLCGVFIYGYGKRQLSMKWRMTKITARVNDAFCRKWD